MSTLSNERRPVKNVKRVNVGRKSDALTAAVAVVVAVVFTPLMLLMFLLVLL